MTLPQAMDLFDYWQICPPENEMLAMLGRAYTTWEPAAGGKTVEQHQAEHRASLEARWKAGAMNAQQLYEAMGGTLGGAGNPHDPGDMPGIGRFPGT